MVYDIIENIETYKGLSDDIYEGLKFLRQATPDIANGVYEINARVKAIVTEYETNTTNQNGYETHRKFIDIQYLVKGKEIICYLPLFYLKEIKPYDEAIDSSFYEEGIVKPQELQVFDGFFAIFFPQDGHKPSLCFDGPKKVKKIVIKIKIN